MSELPAGGRVRRPTIAEIARRAGVSKGAVSFALNGRSGVSEETRARILAIADELNWRPHSAARALGGARAGAVGLVLTRPQRTLGVEPFFGQLLSGLQGELSHDWIALHLMIVDSTEAEMEVYRRWASEHRVDGLVLVDPQIDDPRVSLIEELSLPAIAVGGPGVGHLPCVWADDHDAMRAVMDYVAALGHRRVAHIAGMPNFLHTHRRIEAVREAQEQLGLEEIPSWLTDFSDAEGAAATRRLLSKTPRPTAIVYDSDVMAVAGLGVAIEMGIEVPASLSIVSFDDSVLARLTHPSLTCLTRDTFAFGAQVATSLLDIIANGSAGADIQAPTPVLEVRESTAAPPRA